MMPPQELSGPLGRYIIVRKLGAGGMGTVYLAEDTRLPRKVALKVPHFSTAGNALERFRREAALASGIEHPNLCPVHDLEEVNGILFFIMPYIEGTALSHLIERGTPWPVHSALDLVRKIGGAVAHLHARGIIHRDLKPSNVMLRPSGEPVLMDFGLARDFNSQDARLTSPGTGMGSPSYMAPEQVAGQRDMGPAVDIYGLGVILFELLTGRLPFEDPMPALYVQIMQALPPQPSSINLGLDSRLDALCLKALSKEPAARQKNVEELLHDLTSILATHSPSPPTQREMHPGAPFPLTMYPSQTDQLLASADEASSAVTALEAGADRGTPPHASGRWSKWLFALVPLLLAGLVAGWFLFGGSETPVEDRKDNPGHLEPARAKAPLDDRAAKGLQQAWADWLTRKAEEEFDLGNGVKLTVVLIPPGTFRMGSPKAEQEYVRKNVGGVAGDRADQEVQHEVEITRPFYLGKCEVTQEQYQQLTGKAPSDFKKDGKSKLEVVGLDTTRFPVENVSWKDAVKCCETLGRKVGRTVGLPSEAQWEYACRAGTETPFHFGATLNGTEANCAGDTPYGTTTKGGSLQRTCPVGSYPANAWGLQDMHGNVYEWCQDWDGPFTDLPRTDPLRASPVKGRPNRVLRGGAWGSAAHDCRAAARSNGDPVFSSYGVGFRIAVQLD